MTWLCDTLRCSVFVESPPSHDLDWEGLFGDKPASITERPAQAVKVYAGVVDGYRLSAMIGKERFDWIAKPDPETIDAGAVMPNFGAFPSRVTSFSDRISNWLKAQNGSYRLAFGAILVQPAQSYSDVSSILRRGLPEFPVPTENVQDFLLQFNRPTISKVVPGLELNRLTKWASLQGGLIEVSMQSRHPNQIQVPVSSAIWAQLDLDFNTSASRQEVMSAKDLVALWGELLQHAMEISSNGDQG